MNVLCFLVWLFLSLGFSLALEAPLWVIQRKRDLYERNSVCMDAQRKEIETFGMQPFHAIVTPANTTIWLKCSQCLHPDDTEELEDVWKPSPSVIGRKIQKFLKKIREKIIRSKSPYAKSRRVNLATYCWQKLGNINEKGTSKKKWVTIKSPTFQKTGGRDNQTEVTQFVEELTKKEDENMRKFYLGDHFELEIRNINAAKKGWYRCRNLTGNNDEDISQIYHVDILEHFRTVMYSIDQMPDEVKKADFAERIINENPKIELFWRESEWTPCNMCGHKVGEQRRVKSCYLKRKWSVRKQVKVPYEVFSLFGELPCQSSLVPEELKSKLEGNLTFYEEFAECKKPCTPSKQNSEEVREVTVNETGHAEVLDVLPPGEFSTNERLPPLAPPIIRRTIFATEGDWLMMDCTNQDATALIWRKEFVELNATRIFSLEDGKERQRRVITSRGIFVISSARLDDAGLYSCTAYPSGHILRTFRLFINLGDRSAEVLAAIAIVVRTLLIFFLLLLIFDLLNVKIPSV
ncbi:hypothetical protein niasHS_006578 [Heterodera schachtii]|uniref:Ig-like domain-containing protein n=1 Tax=Heterodera schachtii TaxID=97005 RepID=A0ABD2JHM6_HETSC